MAILMISSSLARVRKIHSCESARPPCPLLSWRLFCLTNCGQCGCLWFKLNLRNPSWVLKLVDANTSRAICFWLFLWCQFSRARNLNCRIVTRRHRCQIGLWKWKLSFVDSMKLSNRAASATLDLNDSPPVLLWELSETFCECQCPRQCSIAFPWAQETPGAIHSFFAHYVLWPWSICPGFFDKLTAATIMAMGNRSLFGAGRVTL